MHKGILVNGRLPAHVPEGVEKVPRDVCDRVRYVSAPMRRFRPALLVLVLGLAAVALAGCGGGGDKGKGDTDQLSGVVQAACNGSRMSAEPKLPASFPQIEEEKVVYTRQSTN